MPVTLTIKGVPDALADALRQRAHANSRSLQRELLLIAEDAVGRRSMRLAEPTPPVHVAPAPVTRKARAAPEQPLGPRLGLEQLWQRARSFGMGHPSESAAIVRTDRDARDRR
jgi:hypothetical protein